MERANCLENAKLRKAPPNPITSAQTMSSWLTAPLTSMPNAGRTKFTSTWKVIERVTKISTLAINSSPTPFSHFIELLLQPVWQIRNAWKRPVRLSDRGTLYNCGGGKSSRSPAAPVNAGQITSFRSSSRWRSAGMRFSASAPPAAPLPRQSGVESFWYSRRRGLRPRCGGQYQLSFSGCRVGPPPLRRTSLQTTCHLVIRHSPAKYALSPCHTDVCVTPIAPLEERV